MTDTLIASLPYGDVAKLNIIRCENTDDAQPFGKMHLMLLTTETGSILVDSDRYPSEDAATAAGKNLIKNQSRMLDQRMIQAGLIGDSETRE